MEIPTKDIIQRIQASIDFGTSLTVGGRNEAIVTIKAQAKEILELQATICRLKEERVTDMIAGDIELEKHNG